METDEQPGDPDHDQHDLDRRAGREQRLPEPVVPETVEGRPGDRRGGAHHNEAPQGHAARSGQQTGHVANAADEAAYEQPRGAATDELSAHALNAHWVLAQAATDPEKQP